LFLLTTPNGDSVTNHNPDHKRHYRRSQLKALLARHFDAADVEYAIPGGKLYSLALRSWSLRHPLRTAVTMTAGWLNAVQSRKMDGRDGSEGMQKLFGIARKLK
jgi:hypothetical protein